MKRKNAQMTNISTTQVREARDYTGKLRPMPEPKGGVLIGTYEDGVIELYRTGARFAVVYGLQMDERLGYATAAEKLGQAILHVAQCEGKLD